MNTDEIYITDLVQELVNHIEENNHGHISRELHAQLEQNGLSNFTTLSMSECHAIAYIGDKDMTNAVSIANNLKITRGGISKLLSRLINRGFVKASQLNDNKREIFYHLTSLGKKVYSIHKTLHAQYLISLQAMVKSYSNEEQLIIKRFLNDLMKNI